MTTVVPGLVSTLLPVYNRPDLLRRAVRSVLEQTYRPIEILLVDDGSTDETPRVVDEWAGAHPGIIRALHIPNGGAGVAREAGRQLARGEFIQHLDSDDELLPRKFELQVAALAADPAAGIAYGPTAYGPDSARTAELGPWKRTGETIETLFPSMLGDRWWGTATPLYRRSLVDAAGPWLNLRVNEDWEYDCRIAAGGVRLAFVPVMVAREYAHSGPRLSRSSIRDGAILRVRAQAMSLIFGHAQRAGIGEDAPEMRHFAHEAFLLARLCGASGQPVASKELYDLAGRAAPESVGRDRKYRLYGRAARWFGWSRIGRLASVRS